MKIKIIDNGIEGVFFLFQTVISNRRPAETSKFIKIGAIIIKNNKYKLFDFTSFIGDIELGDFS